MDPKIKSLSRFPLLLLFAVLPALSTVAAQPNLPGGWPTYGNGPAHTGYFPGTLNGLPFMLKWQTPMPHAVISQAAIGGGSVYFSVGDYYSAMTLRALDASTGQGVWTNALASTVRVGPPTYDAGAVFMQQGDASPNTSYLRSYDAASGHTNWAAPFISQGYHYMAPVVAGGMVFTDTGYYHGLTGINRTSGAQQWFWQLGGSEQWAPAYHNGKVYVWLGSFSEYDPTTGALDWNLTNGLSGGASGRTVAIANGRAYFTSDSSLCAVDLALQTNVWSLNGPFTGTPAVANGIVYAVSNSVVSAYTTNGVFVRSYTASGGGATLYGQLIVTDDVLIVGGSYGIYVFRLADGSLQQYISSARPPYGIYYSSVISLANNTLYVTSSDQNVYAYSATPTTAVTLTNLTLLANGSFQFSFTNIPGATFSAWAATNLALSMSNWTFLGSITQGSPGVYQFTDVQATNISRRFYQVRSP
jgi:hypothetical protein